MNVDLIKIVKKYDFNEELFRKHNDRINYNKGFVFKIRLNDYKDVEEKEIVRCKAFTITLVKKHKDNIDSFTNFEKVDRDFIYADSKGYVYFLEINISFLSQYKTQKDNMNLDLLLNIFDASENNLYFVYDGISLSFIYDHEVVNRDYPFGNIVFDNQELYIDKQYVKTFEIASKKCFSIYETKRKIITNMAYFSPTEYNGWAGDISIFYKDGTYHFIYFFDRHHHGSRYGGGAHTICHLTTNDFKTFVDHGEIVKIDKQYKTAGTGTMFYQNGMYYFSHGWHTNRMVPQDKTSRALFDKELGNVVNGISYRKIYKNGLVPSGAAFLYSKDGINFKRANYQFHIAENPSIFLNENNQLELFAGNGSDGRWIANNIKGSWKRISNLQMTDSILKPTTECPSMFVYNHYKYLMAGRCGFWMCKDNENEFVELACSGIDVYDGLFVPMACVCENRIFYSGWLNGYLWGSVAIHRELFQEENGRLYMKWLKEFEPKADELEKVSTLDINEKTSYYVILSVNSKKDGKLGIRFIGKTSCQLVIDKKEQTLTINNVDENEQFAKKILTIEEQAKNNIDVSTSSDVHYNSVNFSLGKVDHLKENYNVRFIIHYEKKFGSSIIDAEIDGKRTIVSNRINQTFNKIDFNLYKSTINDIKIYKIK